MPRKRAATVSYMQSLGVTRLFAVTDTAPYASYDSVIATMVAADARQSGSRSRSGAGEQLGERARHRLFGGCPSNRRERRGRGDRRRRSDVGIEALWQELFTQLPMSGCLRRAHWRPTRS